MRGEGLGTNMWVTVVRGVLRSDASGRTNIGFSEALWSLDVSMVRSPAKRIHQSTFSYLSYGAGSTACSSEETLWLPFVLGLPWPPQRYHSNVSRLLPLSPPFPAKHQASGLSCPVLHGPSSCREMKRTHCSPRPVALPSPHQHHQNGCRRVSICPHPT